jgi:hypothetical protein
VVAELVVVKGSHRGAFVQLHHAALTIGRSRSTQLCLEQDTKVSGEHAKISPLGGNRFIIEDLGSTNGTFVNEERIEQCPLRSGDLVKIGRSLLIFRAEGASVHLSDIDTTGGGSSAALRPGASGSRVMTPAPDPTPPPDASDASEPLPKLDDAGPSAGIEQQILQELTLAVGELDLRKALERGLGALLVGTLAGRVLLFVRHPQTGGLGCAAIKTQADVHREAPVDPDLLSRAAHGEVVSGDGAVAAPLSVHGQPMGAVYLDGGGDEPHPGLRLRMLAAAGLQLGLLLAADRSARLAASATEIVGLAQAQVTKRPVDLSTLLQGTDRLYSAAAARRRLAWTVEAQPGLMALVDPLLLGRGLDTLVEHVLGVARGAVKIVTSVADGRVCMRIERQLVEDPQVVAGMLDPEGVAADLRRAAQRLDDGALAVARVALLRSGATLSVGVEEALVVYAIELEPSNGGAV